MKRIKVKGKGVEEATENGLKILGISKDEAIVTVLTEGKSGLLGVFGGEEAEVEIKQKVSPGDDAKEILQEIINGLGLIAVAEVVSDNENGVMLDVKGEDLGKVIGKDGAMLKALQLLVSTIVSRDFAQRVRVNIDAGGYRDKQEQALSRLAEEAAKDVLESGIEKVLPPMTAADRRIMHIALKDKPGIETISRGEGAERRLVICPKTDAAA